MEQILKGLSKLEKNIRENERNAGMKKAAMLKKRRRRKRIIAVLVSLALILAVTLSVLSVAFLFRVDEIKVLKNETIYTETEIIKASKIEIDDSLLFINSGNIETEIIRVLPYIKTASIKMLCMKILTTPRYVGRRDYQEQETAVSKDIVFLKF